MICTVIFCLVFTAPAKWRIELRAKIGQYRNRCLSSSEFVYNILHWRLCYSQWSCRWKQTAQYVHDASGRRNKTSTVHSTVSLPTRNVQWIDWSAAGGQGKVTTSSYDVPSSLWCREVPSSWRRSQTVHTDDEGNCRLGSWTENRRDNTRTDTGAPGWCQSLHRPYSRTTTSIHQLHVFSLL